MVGKVFTLSQYENSMRDLKEQIEGALPESGHLVVDSSGQTMPARTYLKFQNSQVTDDKENDMTIITPEGDGGGIEVGDVSGAAASVNKTAATIIWTDPTDVVIDGATLASWAGTKVVRKAGSAPSDPTDGVLVIDNITRNHYASNGFVDSGLVYGTTYYYRFFPYTSQNTVTYGSSVTVTPTRTSISIPTKGSDLVYTGSSQTQSFNNYDSTKMTVSGHTGTNAGSYTATFVIGSDYIWSDGTRENKTVSWSIAKATVTKPTLSGSLVYDGTQKTITVSSYDGNVIQATGTTGTNAGSYTVTFHLLDTSNYEWADHTTADKTEGWSISKAQVTAPAVSNTSKTYNAQAQFPTVAAYDSGVISMTGSDQTNAGDYSISFSLVDSDNYEFKNTASYPLTVAWSIAKAAGSATLSADSVTLDTDHLTMQVTVSNATGTVSVQGSSDSTVATASYSSGTVTISHVNKKSGTATITLAIAASQNYLATTKQIEVEAKFSQVYGASWDGTSTTAWTRTDGAASFVDPVPYVSGASSYSSPFDTIQPWAGMIKSTRNGNVVVAIPKFYYKITQSGSGLHVQVSSAQFDGSSVSPAHMNRGDGKGERDVVYVGRYHCATSDYKSKSGVKPAANATRSAMRTSVHNLGNNIWQMDFATRFTIWLLYIVEFADWNSQAKIGYGCGDNSATGNMGYTDSMPYHTGTTQSSRTTYGLGTQYRNIEGLWDNVYDWLDGAYYNSNGLNIILNPSSFSDSSGGTAVGVPTSGWPSAFTKKDVSGTFPCFIPSASSGSESTYSCDGWYFNASNPCLYGGGNYSQVGSLGLFYVDCTSATNSHAYRGCRLLELP